MYKNIAYFEISKFNNKQFKTSIKFIGCSSRSEYQPTFFCCHCVEPICCNLSIERQLRKFHSVL